MRQAFSDLRELRRELAELATPSSAEEEAGYKLAVSARRFSRRSKKVVDDKLNFSATLMRAGEVDAANRLLEEFERDIRDEEAALIECVNEVKVASSLRRARVSRLRLVRLMAVALLGACVMSFSALGIAVAGMFHDRSTHHVTNAARRVSTNHRAHSARTVTRSRRRSPSMRALGVAGVRDALTAQQLETYQQLAASGKDAQLQSFLLSVLPPDLAQKVSVVLGVVPDVVPSPAPTVAVDTRKIEAKPKKAEPKPASDEPSPKDSQQPPKDGSQSSDDSSGDSGGGGSSHNGSGDGNDSQGLPLPKGFGGT